MEITEDKPEGKKDADDAMKVDEPATSTSATAGESSKAGEAAGTEEPITPVAKPKRTPEPSSERLSNFSRVTPVQFSYISFPADCKYQPVRAISDGPVQRAGKRITGKGIVPPSKYGGGGGIVLLVDKKPEVAAEFIEFAPPAAAAAAPGPEVAAGAPLTGLAGLTDEATEATIPASFEVCSHSFGSSTFSLTPPAVSVWTMIDVQKQR